MSAVVPSQRARLAVTGVATIVVVFLVPCLVLAQIGHGPTASAAGDGASDQPSGRVAYLAIEASGENTERAAEVLSWLRKPLDQRPTLVHVSEVLPPGVWEHELFALGTVGNVGCDGIHLNPTDYQASLQALSAAISGMEQTLPLVERITASWSCLSEPPDPAVLAEVAFQAGVDAAMDPARGAEVASAFEQVFAIAPDFPFDEGLAPRIHSAFLDARDRASLAPGATLRVAAAGGASVWLDGRLVDTPTEPQELRPGHHLVQVRSAENKRLVGLVVFVVAGRSVLVVQRSSLPGLGPVDSGSLTRLQMLARAIADDGSEVDLLVVLPPHAGVWSWRASENAADQLVPHALLTPELVRAARPRRTAGGIVLGTGLAIAVAGAVTAGVSHHESLELRDQMEEWFSSYALHEARYWRLQQANGVGWGLAIAGGVMVGIGLPLATAPPGHGPSDPELVSRPALQFTLSRSGGRLRVAARF